MRKLFLYIVALAAMCSVACGADFEPGSKLEKLRLLGLRADQPFAHPGEHVSLELLAVDPKGRELSLAFATCTDPVASTTDACLAALDAPFELLPTNVADPAQSPALGFDVPEDVLARLPAAARESALIGAAVVACPGTIEPGVTAGVPITCRDGRGRALAISEFEVGVKRVFVREHDRNQNPEITAVSWDGKPWSESEPQTARVCSNRDTHDIDACDKSLRHRITIETRAAESGDDEYENHFSEQLIVQAYATAGFFDHDVRLAENGDFTWIGQHGAANDPAILVFVVRDDRGGVGWAMREVQTR